jgi:hypothetical protein
MRWLRFVFIAAVGLAACSGAASPSAASPPLATYAVKRDITPATLTLQDGGRYQMAIEGFAITGTWTSAQGQLSFTETGGGVCTGSLGTYTWSYTGTLLVMTLVKDVCTVRPEDFANPAGWVKQP